jgi:hypothetical protein
MPVAISRFSPLLEGLIEQTLSRVMAHQPRIDRLLPATTSGLVWQKLGQKVIGHFNEAVQVILGLLLGNVLQGAHAAIIVIVTPKCQ